MFCSHCGSEVATVAVICVKCGAPVPVAPPPVVPPPPPPVPAPTPRPAAAAWPFSAPKSRLAAGLLGLFFGYLGVHRFYLGFTEIGLVQLALFLGLSLVTCGFATPFVVLWGVIEGIVILAGGFDRDGYGRPLAE
jgi:TM2 domain-containing membrane protein YozV